jgi:hypothetical protein
MVDSFQTYFYMVTFEKILRIQNKAADATATIGSFLDIPSNLPQLEFLIEKLLVLAYDIPNS